MISDRSSVDEAFLAEEVNFYVGAFFSQGDSILAISAHFHVIILFIIISYYIINAILYCNYSLINSI